MGPRLWHLRMNAPYVLEPGRLHRRPSCFSCFKVACAQSVFAHPTVASRTLGILAKEIRFVLSTGTNLTACLSLRPAEFVVTDYIPILRFDVHRGIEITSGTLGKTQNGSR